MAADFQLPPLLDYVAVAAWALSGALVAIRKKLDVVGAFMTALTAALGGGLIRDGLLLQRVPPVLTNPVYLPLIAVTTALAIALARRLHAARSIETAIELVDAVGTPAFAVVGVEIARQPGRYLAILVALACALYMALTMGLGLPTAVCAWGVVAAYFAVRLMTVRFDWRTRPVLRE